MVLIPKKTIVKPTLAATAKLAKSNGKPTPSTAGSDFIVLGKSRFQANAVVFGSGGAGKTTVVTEYAPDPVAFISLDRRADEAVRKAMKHGRRIVFLRVDTPANPTKLGDVEARKLGQSAVNKVIKNFEWAVKESLKGNIRTIGLDTGTEYAEMLNLAITGKEVRVKGDYGKSKDLMNREFWRLYNLAREGNAHFILLARAQEIWEGNEPTGRFKPRGPDVIHDGADWCGHIRLSKVQKKNEPKRFELQVTKAGNNIEKIGKVYVSDEESENTWQPWGPFLAPTWEQFEETTQPSDWE
jgi:hypothetical protein